MEDLPIKTYENVKDICENIHSSVAEYVVHIKCFDQLKVILTGIYLNFNETTDICIYNLIESAINKLDAAYKGSSFYEQCNLQYSDADLSFLKNLKDTDISLEKLEKIFDYINNKKIECEKQIENIRYQNEILVTASENNVLDNKSQIAIKLISLICDGMLNNNSNMSKEKSPKKERTKYIRWHNISNDIRTSIKEEVDEKIEHGDDPEKFCLELASEYLGALHEAGWTTTKYTFAKMIKENCCP